MTLNKQKILAIKDIQVKKIMVPVWEEEVYIKQLTRGQADEFYRRQFGGLNMTQEVTKKKTASKQDISGLQIYGHDAFLCACGICDEKGNPEFSLEDVKELEKKNSEAIGFIAHEILVFSNMDKDVEVLAELKN